MSKHLLSLAVCFITVSTAMAIDPPKPTRQNLGDTATHQVGHVRMQPGRATNWSWGSLGGATAARKSASSSKSGHPLAPRPARRAR